MTKAKIAVTVDEDVLATVRARVQAGEAPSVSAYVERALTTMIGDDETWDEYVDHKMKASGGPLTEEEAAWVDAFLDGEQVGPAPTERLRR